MEKKLRGDVYWITGLSGAGKTTLGKRLYLYLNTKIKNLVLLDGDSLREIFQDMDYTPKGRERLASQYGRLCAFLSNQNINVIICTISMFDSVREWNRENIGNGYKEIWLNPPIEELVRRDQKGLYTNALAKCEDNVLGINADYEKPKSPDLIIDTLKYSMDETLEKVIDYFGL